MTGPKERQGGYGQKNKGAKLKPQGESKSLT